MVPIGRVPHVGEDHLVCQYPASILRQISEQTELSRGKFNFDAVSMNQVVGQVDFDWPCFHQRVRTTANLCAMAQGDSDTRQ